MEALFADRVKPIEKSLQILMALYKETPGVDSPILKKRLHNSCIWDKFSLIGLEDIDLRNEWDRGEFMQEQFDKMNIQKGSRAGSTAQENNDIGKASA